MAGHKMLGQYLAMWRDSVEVGEIASDAEHHRNLAALALSGANGDRALARQIFRGFILKLGSDAVFGPPMSDEDLDALLDGAVEH